MSVGAYYRLTKPGIIYGNGMAAVAGFLLASGTHIRPILLLSMLIGTALVIACGCVINNYLDRDIDRHMARTKKRALATGEISVPAAMTFAAVLGVAGFAILIADTNWLTVGVGALGLFSYVVLYSIGKRTTKYGTLIGTISGATPPVAGYCAVTGRLDLAALLLFAVMLCWQMAHFYSIAMYRLKDYQAAGLPVWPAQKGMHATKRQIIFFIVAFIAACATLTIAGYTGYIYLAVMVGVGAAWLRKGMSGFHQADDVRWARGMFGFSLIVLLTFSASISLGGILP